MKGQTAITIEDLVIHQVGNQQRDEALVLSNGRLELPDELMMNLQAFVQKTLNNSIQTFQFSHHNALSLNEAYRFSGDVFDDPDQFLSASEQFAKHLYQSNNHHAIKAGELLVARIANVRVGNELHNGLVLLKAESKETILRTFEKQGVLTAEAITGLGVGKFEKAAIVVNKDRAEGFYVICHEQGSVETQHWREAFLQVTLADSEKSKTADVLELCKNYSENYLRTHYGRREEVLFIDQSLDYLSKNDDFNLEEFKERLVGNGEDEEAFSRFQEHYLPDPPHRFDLSREVVQYQKKKFKRDIKLDDNFVIKILNTDTHNIKTGFDSTTGMKFYQIFFENES